MRQVMAANPDALPITLANVLKSAGYPRRALPYIEKTRALLPHNRDVLLNEAAAHLQSGDYTEGWKAWEQRPDLDARFRHLPLWQGQPIDHLLLYEDQGFGDAILGTRYIPMLAERVDRVTLQLPRTLQKLMAHNFPTLKTITLDDPIPAARARCRLMSLPALFNTEIVTIPPYALPLRADDAEDVLWRERLTAMPHPRIGVVWGGNTINSTDPLRSLPSKFATELLQAGGSHFVSMQKGEHKKGIDLDNTHVFDAAPMLDDFNATAGLMAGLDLIITTCTSTAHLAGAMGKPTWLMVSFDPYWIWLLGREDSPWYPSLRLFRQPAPGDWQPVITCVIDALKRFLAGDTSTLTPRRYEGKPLLQNPYALKLPGDV
jgi:hypothetical protein